jgi:hypothetical protein
MPAPAACESKIPVRAKLERHPLDLEIGDKLEHLAPGP